MASRGSVAMHGAVLFTGLARLATGASGVIVVISIFICTGILGEQGFAG